MNGLKDWAERQRAPVTVGILGSLILAALVFWFAQMRLAEMFFFDPDWLAKPWSLVTYPWVFAPLGAGPWGILSVVFLVWWMSWVGGWTEREMGSTRFAIFWVVMTALPALLFWLGGSLLRQPYFLMGPWLPEAAITVAYCTQNPNATVNLFCVIPVSGKWLKWIVIGGLFFMYGSVHPLMGLFGVASLLLAMAFANNMLPIAFAGGRRPAAAGKKKVHASRAQAQYDESYFDEVLKRERERDERERLRKLFEGSMKDE